MYFAFILLWKINFPNEISKRNLGRLLCEKKIYSATNQILPSFVRFLNYIELFWEKVAFLFFQGREMSRVYIYIYILIITGVQASWVIIDRLLRQCCFVWSEIVGPHSSGNFNDWPLKLKAGSKIWVVVIGILLKPELLWLLKGQCPDFAHARASSVFSSKDNRTVILTRQDFLPDRTADRDLLFIFSSNILEFRISKKSFVLYKNLARGSKTYRDFIASWAPRDPKISFRSL